MAGHPFDRETEAEYVRARLDRNRLLIRMACLCSVALGVLRGVEQAFAELWHPAQPVGLALVIAASVALALIAWTRAYPRFYLPVANMLVPARNALAALFIAGAAAHGQSEMLMLLPLLVLSPFFFLGLSFRVSVGAGALTIACFVLAAASFGLALPVMLRSSVFLLLFVIACAIGAWQLELWSRKAFVESRLIASLAQHDPLTGLKNRRIFDEQLNRLWQQAITDRRSLAILLVDVDHFKALNDRLGHQAGDRTLQRVAQALQAYVTRPLDVLARYGGEEFGIVLYDIDAAGAEGIAERMRRAVGELGVERGTAPGRGAVTVSIGVAFVEPSRDRQSRGALQLADQALYEAKVRGRNRVVLMDQGAHRLLETGVFKRATLAAGR